MPGYPYSHSSPPAPAGTHINLRQMKEVLKKDLQTPRSRNVFDATKTDLPALANHHTPLSVLAVLGDESARRYPEKEALTRTLVAEYQGGRESLWSSLLLVAYYPVLWRLRSGIRSEAFCACDLDALVTEKFLEVVAEFPLSKIKDRTCMHLRQQTRRMVFRTVKEAEQEHRLIECMDDDDVLNMEPAAWPEPPRMGEPLSDPDDLEVLVTLLFKHAGGAVPRRKLDVVVATLVRGERLRTYVERRHPRASDTERRRTYERLKRERTRTIGVLRGLLADLVVPD